MEKRRAALVLAGGGARGVAHIGAIEELESQGFEVHAVAGTSMGALGGGMYASGHLEAFKEWMYTLDKYKVFSLVDFALSTEGLVKGNRVIGAMKELVPDVKIEKMPLPWLFDWLSFLIIDLGGTTGQLGVDTQRTVFAADSVRVAPAVCYESVYGAYVGEFVRGGAQLILVITNDGWWRDTAIHRQHFSFSRLRAIEHRRAVARSANTGISGFIYARGDVVGPTLGWARRGVLTAPVALSDELTVYTRYGDYLGRIAQYVMLLCLLYYVAYRVKRRNYLVD